MTIAIYKVDFMPPLVH